MHLSTAARSLLIYFFALLSVSCGGGSGPGSETSVPYTSEPQRAIPFLNKEPETYSASIYISYNGQTETKLIAKKGLLRRIENHAGTDRSLVLIESDQRYAVDPRRKVYTVIEDAAGYGEPDFIREMTSQLLAMRADSEFERLSDEDGLERYKVTLGRMQSTEIVVYVDPALQMPVKQVFYIVSGEERTPAFSVVFKDIVLAADDAAFQVPADHRKIDEKTFFRGLGGKVSTP